MINFTRGSISTAPRWILLFVAVVIMAAFLPLLHLTPAFADTGSYPWYNAPYTGTQWTWGYNPCPSNDPKCMKMIDKGYGTADPWGYNLRNCTSYVAWKINQVFGVNNISGWGNAATWNTGYYKPQPYAVYSPSDYTPQVGDIAQWGSEVAGGAGHVAYVYAVNNGIAGLDEYNVGEKNVWGVFSSNRTTASNSAGVPDHYIHIGTIPPSVPWHFENLEGGKNAVSPYQGNVGQAPASVVFNGQIYVYYYDASKGDLRVAYTYPQWLFDVVDGEGGGSGKLNADVGQVPSALVFNNVMYVFYYDKTDGNLRMAWSSDGRAWQAETLDGDPGSLSGYNANVGQTPYAVVYNNSLQVFYYQPDQGVLRHAWSGNGSSWNFETLDGNTGSISHFSGNVGLDPSAVVYNGSLQLFYYNQGQGDLRHAWSDANGWHFENLDGDAGSIGHSGHNVGGNPTAFVFQNNLGVFYYDKTQKSLRHAWSDANGWHFEVLAGGSTSILGDTSDIGTMSTAVVSGTTLQVFVYQAGNGNLVHIWNDGSWHEENLDGAGGQPTGRIDANVGLDPVAIMFGSTLDVFYYDADHGALRHTWPN